MTLDRRTLLKQLAAHDSTQHGAAIAALYQTEMAAITFAFQQHKQGVRMGEERSALVDTILRTLADRHWPETSYEMALVAVGGYGRGLLAPHSDIDVVLLTQDETAASPLIAALLSVLWDAGFKIGHSVLTPEAWIAAAGGDAIKAASLLDARFLCGSNGLFARTFRPFQTALKAGNFIAAKKEEQQQRHAVPAYAAYRVEPNVKEGYGGLRDLQTLWWWAKAQWNIQGFEDLYTLGYLRLTDITALKKATQFYWSVRCALHALRGKAEEKISFAVQPELAAFLGYQDRPPLKAMERLMRHYHYHVRQVVEVERLYLAATDKALAPVPAKELQVGFVAYGRYVHFAENKPPPTQWLHLFVVALQRGLEVHPNALTFIRQHLSEVDESVRQDRAVNADFLTILTSKTNPLPMLQLMTDIGLLGAFIPDYGRVVGLMQYDLNHVYTVDEHTLHAIGWLHRLTAGELAEVLPKAHGILPEIGNARVLFVAVFLHDIAKGRGGDHSQKGAEVARVLCPRLGLNPSETEIVAWLVEQHLLLSFYAFRRDIQDPDTLVRLAATVQSVERLRLLFVLTVVDIKATNPALLNEWKASLLRELYQRAEEYLGGNLQAIGRERQVTLAQYPFVTPAREALFADLPQAYWLSLPASTHARQVPLLEAYQGGVAVHTETLAQEQGTEVTILAPDQTGVFAQMAGAMTSARVTIREARIFTLHSGIAFDTFVVESLDGKALWHDQAARLTARLTAVLEGRDTTVPNIQPPLPDSLHPPRITFDNHTSKTSTILEIRALDFPGLLYAVSTVLLARKIRIDRAKIATFNKDVADIFYIRTPFGLKVEAAELQEAIRQEMEEVLLKN